MNYPDLPVYNANATCPKCACQLLKSQWTKRTLPQMYGDVMERPRVTEVIERTCCNCTYSWDELPLDNEYVDKDSYDFGGEPGDE